MIFYTYKGKKYKQLANCKMKDSNSGLWVSAVVYHPIDDENTIYVRDEDDFLGKFKMESK